MPRCVRNFWIDLSVDGRKTTFQTGPRGSWGGFSLRILMRDQGSVVDGMTIRGCVDNGDLVLNAISDVKGRIREIQKTTKRDKPAKPNKKKMPPVERLVYEVGHGER